MDLVRKRSASQADLGVPFRKRVRRTNDPLSLLVRVAELTNSSSTAISKPRAIPTQISDEREDTPDIDFPERFPAAAATATLKPANRNGCSIREGEKEEDEETSGSETEASMTPKSASPKRETHANNSRRLVIKLVLPPKKSRTGVTQIRRNPVRKGDSRHRATPLEKQHKLEQKTGQIKESSNVESLYEFLRDFLSPVQEQYRGSPVHQAGYMSDGEDPEAFSQCPSWLGFPPPEYGLSPKLGLDLWSDPLSELGPEPLLSRPFDPCEPSCEDIRLLLPLWT